MDSHNRFRHDDQPEEHGAASSAEQEKGSWRIVAPVPDDAPEPPAEHHEHGAPSMRHDYRTEDGQVMFYSDRFDQQYGGKTFAPLTCWEDGAGNYKWRWKASPAPRPLYGLDQLAAHPDAPVLIVEGEKTADAAQKQFPDHVVVTSSGGSNAVDKTDWAPLSGRQVTVWPDNDDPGRKYAELVVKLAKKVGADRISIVENPEGFPLSWDLGDELPADRDDAHYKKMLDEAESWKPDDPEHYVSVGSYRSGPDGVYLTYLDDDKSDLKLCGPLEVLACTRNTDGDDWGRLLRWCDADGNIHHWSLPMELLAGDGTELRRELLSRGLDIESGRSARQELLSYLQMVKPEGRARAVNRIGWHGEHFVFPDYTIGETSDEQVLFQTTSHHSHVYRQSGDLEQWKAEVASYAVGNDRLIFAICCALAAPLLEPTGAESGGFNLIGPSSTGKTTALQMAGSVWGGGGTHGYIRQWRTTDNGLEAMAASHCDTLLCLDELSQIDAQSASRAAYTLANGQGKTRATRTGAGRKPAEWRVLVLSSGEIRLADKVTEDSRLRKPSAGQHVRFIDLSADAGAGLGIFETLHSFKDAGALARHLKAASAKHYGCAATEFVRHLISNKLEMERAIQGYMEEFVAEVCPAGADGQVERVAQRFGLLAAAGELAIKLDIVPWSARSATTALKRCFKDWLDQRGDAGALERTEVIRQVRLFFEQHGDSRFTPWDKNPDAYATQNRAGFRKKNDKEWEYYVLPEVWRDEVCRGLDIKTVNRVLIDEGLLIPDKSTGKASSSHRLPGFNGPKRCYHLSSKIIGDGDAS